MDTKTIVLESTRLQLREAALSDAPFFYSIMNSPGWLEGIGDRGIHDLACAKIHIRDNLIQNYRKLGIGMYVVCTKDEPELPIGLCGLIKRDGLEDIDIGFAFTQESAGHGYALEAAQSVMAHGKNTLKLEKIVAITSQTNWRSARLLESLGMSFQKNIQLKPDDESIRLFF